MKNWSILTWYGRWRHFVMKPLRRIEARWIKQHPPEES